MRPSLCVLMLACVLVGCTADSQTYSVSIKNETRRPITIALAKTGGPVEDQWASPEQIADGLSRDGAAHGFEAVPPGRTARVSNLRGSFPQGIRAVLRVYAGQLSLSDMLRIYPGAFRVDVELKPGANDLTVRNANTGLTVEPRTSH